MRPSSIQAVVFDLDGLMFNTEELYQFVGGELLRRRGKLLEPELLDAMMGRPARVSLQIMIDWHGLTDTTAVLAAETDEIFAVILSERLAFMPGLDALLHALEKHNIPKAIGTSSGRAFVTRVLSQFNLEPRFKFVLTAEDVMEGKPQPEIYLKAAERFNLPPAQVMVLEDSQNGCRAAVAAGSFAVAVPSGHSLRHTFTGASIIAESLADPRIYEALGIAATKGDP